MENALIHAVKKANQELLKEASGTDEHLKGMGTTIVVATIIQSDGVFCECRETAGCI